jgi:hypothetical protein
MEICVKVIEHKYQRYPTVGDWIYNKDNGRLTIWISKMSDWRYEYLVAFHEQIEATLCIQRGIEEKDVTKFDLWYESQRAAGASDCQFEPGDHKDAPYKKEHFVATNIERQMAVELGVDWSDYEAAIDSL